MGFHGVRERSCMKLRNVDALRLFAVCGALGGFGLLWALLVGRANFAQAGGAEQGPAWLTACSPPSLPSMSTPPRTARTISPCTRRTLGASSLLRRPRPEHSRARAREPQVRQPPSPTGRIR